MDNDPGEGTAEAPRRVDVGNVAAYCSSLAAEFTARRNRVRRFVRHNLASGEANEAILRSLLASIGAGAYGATDGFVCNPLRGESSRQCDIVVYDRRFPLVYAEGGVTLVWPESARMVIEVKTKMTREDLRGAVRNIASVRRLDAGSDARGIIFAFDSVSPQAAMDVLAEGLCAPEHQPAAVLLLRRGAIIHQPDISQVVMYGGGTAPYELLRCTGDDPPGSVLTYLFLLYLRSVFHSARGSRTAGDLQMATDQFLAQRTARE